MTSHLFWAGLGLTSWSGMYMFWEGLFVFCFFVFVAAMDSLYLSSVVLCEGGYVIFCVCALFTTRVKSEPISESDGCAVQ